MAPRPGAGKVYPVPWSTIKVEHDDRHLEVLFTASADPGCTALDHVDATTQTGMVTVTVYLRNIGPTTPDASGIVPACSDVGTLAKTTVLLSEALSTRTLRDGATPYQQGRVEH